MSMPDDRDRAERDRPLDRERTTAPAPTAPLAPTVPGDTTHDPAPGQSQATPESAAHASAGAPAPVDGRRRHTAPVGENDRSVQREVIAREKEAFGGIKWGSAFFGWLTAIGTAVLLTALVAGTGTALGLATNTTAEEVVEGATQSVDTVGIVGAILLAIIVFVAYYSGGYVAGRMARLEGIRQGVAVWVWALVIAVIVAVIGALGGADLNVLSRVNGFPRLPVGEGELTTIGVITAVVALLVSLIGAIIGGLVGMRFHRRVDRAGLGINRG